MPGGAIDKAVPNPSQRDTKLETSEHYETKRAFVLFFRNEIKPRLLPPSHLFEKDMVAGKTVTVPRRVRVPTFLGNPELVWNRFQKARNLHSNSHFNSGNAIISAMDSLFFSVYCHRYFTDIT